MPSPQFPPSVVGLNLFSLFITICILVLSIHDCGILSLCLNPPVAIITAGYHITILALAYRRLDDAPTLPIGYIVWAYFLSLSWLAAYIAMAMILLQKPREIPLFDLHLIVPRHMRNFQKLQMLLDPLECVILGDLAIKGTMNWRVAANLSKEQVP